MDNKNKILSPLLRVVAEWVEAEEGGKWILEDEGKGLVLTFEFHGATVSVLVLLIRPEVLKFVFHHILDDDADELQLSRLLHEMNRDGEWGSFWLEYEQGLILWRDCVHVGEDELHNFDTEAVDRMIECGIAAILALAKALDGDEDAEEIQGSSAPKPSFLM